MSENFNVLLDPWIPLDENSGKVTYTTYFELMTGTCDAADLVHPRDDVRFFARMLLSALTQALFGDIVPDAASLRKQLVEPLPVTVAEERIARVKDDFALFGAGAFLQGPPRREKKSEKSVDDSVDSMLFDACKHQLYRVPSGVGFVDAESAVPLLYSIQAFARKGGSGYFPGVRGAPPTTTLVKLDSVRASVWANVLHGQRRLAYPDDRARAWKQAQSDAQVPIGLVEGLFWQSLAAQLSSASDRHVSAATGRTIMRGGVGIRRLGGRMRAGGIWFPHPYSPVREDDAKPKFLHLRSERPAWTGIGDLLPGLQEDGERRTKRPAPVVEQWAELDAPLQASLAVLDYATKDASVLARFVELFPLSAALRDNRLADFASRRVEDADGALQLLRERLFPFKANKKHGEAFLGRAAGRKNGSDVTAAFWRRTERFFWRAFDLRLERFDLKLGASDPSDEFRRAVERITLEIFDEMTSILDSDPVALARIVRQRVQLKRHLSAKLGLSKRGAETVSDRGSEKGDAT